MVSNLFRLRFVCSIVLVSLSNVPLVWTTSQLNAEIHLYKVLSSELYNAPHLWYSKSVLSFTNSGLRVLTSASLSFCSDTEP